MSDTNSSSWQPKGDECPNCGKTMLEGHEYDLCYGCTSNKRIARDASQQMEPSPRALEIQQEIEAAVERDGRVEIDTSREE